MNLQAGQELLQFRLLEPVGAGGMGVVWKAVDTTLDREVAIKVLPDLLADDPERLARFQREARVLASLNHPNIATVHGYHEVAPGPERPAVRFLCMEFVTGEDLSQRLGRGPLPVGEALPVALAIAQAMEAAHEKGVVHRDLKPANVMLTPDGAVKVLDFGLAKALDPAADASGVTSPTMAPTLTSAGTVAGMILGTAAYMSPEQARGKPVDRRTDIWAFGCVLYECLTGRRVFAGESLTDVLAGIVEREPDWSQLPAAVPADVRRLLRRCLQKDPRVRLRDIGEARVVLAGDVAAEGPAEVPVRARTLALPFVAGLVVASVAWLGLTLLRPDAVVGPEAGGKALHVTLAMDRPSWYQVSPDGNRLLYAQDGQLWIRDLADLEPRPLSGTDGKDSRGLMWAQWSPDGDSIAFAREGSLEVLRLGETRPQRRSDLPDRIASFSWGDDGSFLLEMQQAQGVHLLTPGSSILQPLDWIETKGRVSPDRVHPSFLPGSEEFLVTLAEEGGPWIHVASLKTRSTRRLVRGGSRAAYVHPGWLAWVDDGRLLVQSFDPATATVSGAPHELVGDVFNFASTGVAAFSFSREGTLVYVPWSGPSRIEWVDRQGRSLGPAGEPRHYASVRLDPTGRFLATSIATPETAYRDLWIIDLERGTPQRLTHEDRWENDPAWSPDGKHVAFSADWKGPPNIYVKSTDGGESREIVPFNNTVQVCGSWTPDGRSVVYVNTETGPGDIWSVDVKTLERRRLLETPFDERDLQLSPDGRWLAYSSDESGREEVYVASFPDLAGRRRVSSGGGDKPRWRADSRELFFRTAGRAIASVGIEERQRRPEPGRETIVIQGSEDLGDFDVTPDGSRFLVLRANESAVRPESHLITRWQRLLEK